jgi:hypothetical protein
MNSAVHIAAAHGSHRIFGLQREWQFEFHKAQVSADVRDPGTRGPENR